MMDWDMARTMRSGTSGGPGICRNGRPERLTGVPPGAGTRAVATTAPVGSRAHPCFRECQEGGAAAPAGEVAREGTAPERPAIHPGVHAIRLDEEAEHLVAPRGRLVHGHLHHEGLAPPPP